MAKSYGKEILVEAEEFDDFGGWIMDSQFDLEMGSPYLLAHGNGTPVSDAKTVISVAEAGEYNVWVRAMDWVPGYHPGTFTLEVNGVTLDTIFGANDKGWTWQSAGKVVLPTGKTKMVLHDLTGFCGRCDAILFNRDDTAPPEAVDEVSRAWRRHLRGLPASPPDGGTFDVIVIGAGIAGTAAALAAARLGERVALIQDRPYLGGNASLEIGLSPRGIRGPLINELSGRTANGDLCAMQLLENEPAVTVLTEYTVYDALVSGSTIVSVDAREARSGREIRLTAPVFIDCSGKALFGSWAGAETLFGQESRDEYNEGFAPIKGDDMHHGNTLFFRTKMADAPVSFPAVPWATQVAKDFADLRGQLQKPGLENGPGPVVFPPGYVADPVKPISMKGPLTHFWEYGQWLDPYTNGEHIRDHLLCAIYGTFHNVKTLEPQKYARLDFDWVAFVPAQGQYRRYRGDYVLTENDIRSHKAFPDVVVQNGGAFCLHYPGDETHDFRLKRWEWDERDRRPYEIPFRTLYSSNVSNLMMAGKHMSATHVASSNTKFMGNGGQHGIATAAAAHLCHKHKTTPRGIFRDHLAELQEVVAVITGPKARFDGWWIMSRDGPPIIWSAFKQILMETFLSVWRSTT